ncbi:MAG TPA: tyrosine-type recombinase/integrase [Bryobacteraceae bacterium]|nr:tyrosine-type recombinase/integrase [Bryobacteraceae bacterium]
MLNLYRRHRSGCSKAGIRTQDCPSKPKCAIHFEGIDGTGIRHKPQALKDPSSGSGVRDWNRAAEIIREMELPRPVEQTAKPQTNLSTAIDAYLAFKSHRSDDVRRKAQLVLTRLQKFLELRNKRAVSEITLTDLAAFRATWTSASTTQRRDQDSLRSFFRFCVRSKFISYNVAADLDPIKITRPKTEPFTSEEVERILSATDRLTDEYGRTGSALALQTKAFVLVMRYSGLAIGDVAKLRKADVQGTRIRTSRKKTGKEVFCTVPQFVIDALNAAPHDSNEYFFWNGKSKIHTRASKWGLRLQRLFALAEVRTVEVTRKRRSGGKLKEQAEAVIRSLATPHMFRHTLARDLLERGVPMEDVAEILGHSMAITEKYYAKFDKRREARLEQRLQEFWENDRVTKALA